MLYKRYDIYISIIKDSILVFICFGDVFVNIGVLIQLVLCYDSILSNN